MIGFDTGVILIIAGLIGAGFPRIAFATMFFLVLVNLEKFQ